MVDIIWEENEVELSFSPFIQALAFYLNSAEYIEQHHFGFV